MKHVKWSCTSVQPNHLSGYCKLCASGLIQLRLGWVLHAARPALMRFCQRLFPSYRLVCLYANTTDYNTHYLANQTPFLSRSQAGRAANTTSIPLLRRLLPLLAASTLHYLVSSSRLFSTFDYLTSIACCFHSCIKLLTLRHTPSRSWKGMTMFL